MPAEYNRIRSSQVIATHEVIVLSYALNAGPLEEAHLTLYDMPHEPEVGANLVFAPGGSPRILATATATPGMPNAATRTAILAHYGVYARLSGGDAIAYIVTQDKT